MAIRLAAIAILSILLMKDACDPPKAFKFQREETRPDRRIQMRYLIGAIAVAGMLALASTPSHAQACTSQKVAAGYKITGSDGYSYSCCQGYTGGGSCTVKSCKVGLASPVSPPRYKYERTITQSRCLGSLVK